MLFYAKRPPGRRSRSAQGHLQAIVEIYGISFLGFRFRAFKGEEGWGLEGSTGVLGARGLLLGFLEFWRFRNGFRAFGLRALGFINSMFRGRCQKVQSLRSLRLHPRMPLRWFQGLSCSRAAGVWSGFRAVNFSWVDHEPSRGPDIWVV